MPPCTERGGGKGRGGRGILSRVHTTLRGEGGSLASGSLNEPASDECAAEPFFLSPSLSRPLSLSPSPSPLANTASPFRLVNPGVVHHPSSLVAAAKQQQPAAANVRQSDHVAAARSFLLLQSPLSAPGPALLGREEGGRGRDVSVAMSRRQGPSWCCSAHSLHQAQVSWVWYRVLRVGLRGAAPTPKGEAGGASAGERTVFR